MPPPIRRSDSSIYSNARSTSVERTSTRATPGKSSKNAVKENRVTHTTTRANEDKATTTKSKTYDNKKTGQRDTYEYRGQDTQAVEKKKVTPELKVSAEKSFVKTEPKKLEGSKDLGGGVTANGFVEGPSFELKGSASVQNQGWSGFDVNVDLKIEANLLKAGGSVEKEFKFKVNGEDVAVKIKLGAEGQVGIDGSVQLKLHVGKDGVSVSAGAEGFAGAKGSLAGEITTSINGNEVAKGKLGITAAAGAMAGVEFEAGLTHFKTKAYAAVGVGVGIEVSGEVKADKLAKEIPGLLTTWDD